MNICRVRDSSEHSTQSEVCIQISSVQTAAPPSHFWARSRQMHQNVFMVSGKDWRRFIPLTRCFVF